MTDSPFHIRVVILSLTDKEIGKLPNRAKIKINKYCNKHSHFKYGTHPREWNPFEADTSVFDILEKQKKELEEKLGVTILDRTDELPKSGELVNLIEWIDKKGEPCLFILDHMVLESPEWEQVVGEIDSARDKIGCIMPISDNLPDHIRKDFAKLRERKLIHLCIQFKLPESTAYLRVGDTIEFNKALFFIAGKLKQVIIYTLIPPEEIEVLFKRHYESKFVSTPSMRVPQQFSGRAS